jgi:pimeloyl-ACP methyl ester carboxylesterase
MAKNQHPLAQLLTITANDGLMLPALYYSAGPESPLVIWLHGMGSTGSFYAVERTNALASALLAKSISFLALNNRGAHFLQGVKFLDKTGEYQKRLQGTSHELIAESIFDIEGAINFAKSNSHSSLFLVGHSTGANKICVYNYHSQNNPFKGYVLFGGGDDTGLFYEQLGRDRFFDLMQESKSKVEQGQGAHLVPERYNVGPFSYQSLDDILDPDGDYNTFPFIEQSTGVKLSTKPLFREFKSIDKPTLVMYGSEDEYCPPSAAVAENTLKSVAPHPDLFTFELIPEADHSAHGHEPRLASLITKWIKCQLERP